ncbi:glycoside hydrolase family 43 protein [Serendipita vermifera MAFF 305830]|uniref:Arabinan endo-1,5-alpha-L-arabinosidase n=1 Tax=Serendipita vermifera MAFF 305830 TaxID=933852 RepID=A0A0C2WJW9_SERVB|nr:glycoside hydrolase family 43 protein [Serendipita vermifera MAFF 305830]
MKFSLPAISIAIIGLLSHAVAAYPNPGAVSGSIDVHDPTICRDSSGKWFLFATAPGISIRTSTDRINWSYVGTVWSSGQATWTNTYTGTSNGNLWAPDCTYKSGTFYLYYSASSFGSNKSAIFFAKSTTGLPGSWSNLGLVTSTTTSNNYNAIDPNLIIDGSNWWLSLGSWWTGIKLIQLNPSTGKPSGSTVYSIAQRTAANGAIEAPIIVKNGSYYYLFTSWDICCQGTSSTYNIRVGRSTSITGPYVDKSGVKLTSGGGTLVLAKHDAVYGPGGQHVYKDTDAWVIDYHYYTSSGSKLGINLLDFSSGWPVAY